MLQSAEKPSEEIGRALCMGIANRDQTDSSACWGWAENSRSGRGHDWDSRILPDDCPLLGTARLPLVSSSLVSAEAAAERQLVPADGKGWENESATRGEGSSLQEESVCVETNSSFHMQVVLVFIQLFLRWCCVLTTRALLRRSQRLQVIGIWIKYLTLLTPGSKIMIIVSNSP